MTYGALTIKLARSLLQEFKPQGFNVLYVHKNDLEQFKLLDVMLHQLLLESDLTASAQIAEIFGLLLIEQLVNQYPNLSDPLYCC